MQLHHPDHLVASAGHQKKCTHYFRELLMLFFAVFFGFLAEYRLEHMSKERKKDTIGLNSVVSRNKEIAAKLDTFRLLIKENA